MRLLLPRALQHSIPSDIQSHPVAHAEMSGFLNNMEGIVLLADQGVKTGYVDKVGRNGARETSVVRTQLQPEELGELLLVSPHLLDYGSPPFPTGCVTQFTCHRDFWRNATTAGNEKTHCVAHRRPEET
jgi:hypothetical protein